MDEHSLQPVLAVVVVSGTVTDREIGEAEGAQCVVVAAVKPVL